MSHFAHLNIDVVITSPPYSLLKDEFLYELVSLTSKWLILKVPFQFIIPTNFRRNFLLTTPPDCIIPLCPSYSNYTGNLDIYECWTIWRFDKDHKTSYESLPLLFYAPININPCKSHQSSLNDKESSGSQLRCGRRFIATLLQRPWGDRYFR